MLLRHLHHKLSSSPTAPHLRGQWDALKWAAEVDMQVAEHLLACAQHTTSHQAETLDSNYSQWSPG